METIQRDSIWCNFFYTELTAGLRRGEICGLKWEDFDETHDTLEICRTIHEEKGGKLTVWDTKTAAGTRTIKLSPSTAALLRKRQKTALTEWIFPHPWKPEQPTRLSASYERRKILLKEAGLPDIRSQMSKIGLRRNAPWTFPLLVRVGVGTGIRTISH